VPTKTEFVSRLTRETGFSRSTVYRKLEKGELTLDTARGCSRRN
jgi:transcriptional regulator of acetoin/glycerol metabolism